MANNGTVTRPVVRSTAGITKWFVNAGMDKTRAHDLAIGGDWTELKGQALTDWLTTQLAAPAPLDAPEDPKAITDWLVAHGLPEHVAGQLESDGQWRKFKDPSLRVEYLTSLVAGHQQHQDQAATDTAKERVVAQLLVRDGYLDANETDDTKFGFALADWQRDNKINAGNGLLDDQTIAAVQARLLPTVPAAARATQWQTLLDTAKKDVAANTPLAPAPAPTTSTPALPPAAAPRPPAASTPAVPQPPAPTLSTGNTAATSSIPAAPTVAPLSPADKLPPHATDAQVMQYLHKNYPDAQAWLQNPELRKVILDTAKTASEHGGYIDPADWDTALHQTIYWQTHSPASRAFDQAIGKGDGSADDMVRLKKQDLQAALVQQGITLGDAELGDLAKKAIRGAWTPTDVNKWMASRLGSTTALPGGDSQDEARSLQTVARQFGVKLPDSTAKDWSLRILAGTTTDKAFGSYLRDMATTTWSYDPSVTRALGDGIAPATYFGPHTQKIADTLELDPEQVDLLNDPKYSGVLRFFDPATKQQRAMTPTEATQWARDQPEFKTTTAYKQREADIGMSLARFFGAAPGQSAFA